MLGLIKADAEEVEEGESWAYANELWKVGAHICILMAALPRGHEGSYVIVAGLWKHVAKGRIGEVPPGLSKSTLLMEEACKKPPHVTLCLLGKFKGETRTNHHLIALVNKTVSRLEPRWWIKKLISVCEVEGREQGPAFPTSDGMLALLMDYDAMLQRYLV